MSVNSKTKFNPVKVWKEGDRACFSASPTCAANRRVYTGTIVKDKGSTVLIVDDGWGATSEVGKRFLHNEGAYEILDYGPVGIRWTDR